MAHRQLGTLPEGAVRFSLGLFNTEAEIDTALDARARARGATQRRHAVKQTVDARGLACPQPVVLTGKAIVGAEQVT